MVAAAAGVDFLFTIESGIRCDQMGICLLHCGISTECVQRPSWEFSKVHGAGRHDHVDV